MAPGWLAPGWLAGGPGLAGRSHDPHSGVTTASHSRSLSLSRYMRPSISRLSSCRVSCRGGGGGGGGSARTQRSEVRGTHRPVDHAQAEAAGVGAQQPVELQLGKGYNVKVPAVVEGAGHCRGCGMSRGRPGGHSDSRPEDGLELLPILGHLVAYPQQHGVHLHHTRRHSAHIHDMGMGVWVSVSSPALV